MKLLVYGDLHATEGPEFCFNQPSRRLQDWRVEKFLRFLRKTYKAHDCDGLVDLGDSTSDRSAIPVPTINTLCKNFMKFPETAYNLKLIGNHEQFTRNATVDVGSLFLPFFEVFSEPAVIEESDCDFVMAPYPGSHPELEKWLKDNKGIRNKPRVLFGHFQAMGASTRGGMLMEGISKDVLKPFDLVLLGHIHKPQQLAPNAYYVGSPFQQNWGESGENKRVAILDTSDLSLNWIPIEDFPVYKTVSLKEFMEVFDEKSEDRYEVVVHSSEEAAKIYNFKFASRVRPRYEMTRMEESTNTVVADGQPWDVESTMRRFVKRNPANLDLTEEELVQTGCDIAQLATKTVDDQLPQE